MVQFQEPAADNPEIGRGDSVPQLTPSSDDRPVRQLIQEMLSLDALDLAPRLTLILLLLHIVETRTAMVMLCGIAILIPKLYRSSYFWLLVSVAMLMAILPNWYGVDNHKYLLLYWCLALCFAMAGPRPRRVLHLNARLLIGLCFLFATFWKATSDDYLSGDFFHYTLLTDVRFQDFAAFSGAMPQSAFHENAEVISRLFSPDSPLQEAQLEGSPRLRRMAVWMTWAAIGLEGLIAIAFLLPAPARISRWRHPLLMLFALGTYSLAPVVGFGWVLMAMGVAQCDSNLKWDRMAYVLLFFLIQGFTLPWSALVQW